VAARFLDQISWWRDLIFWRARPTDALINFLWLRNGTVRFRLAYLREAGVGRLREGHFDQLIETVGAMSVKRARPGQQAEKRRERLVEAAYRAMLRTGLGQLRTRDVAAEAGITVATLHYYFPTKDDLVKAVVEYASESG
jgi:hypothetical protein